MVPPTPTEVMRRGGVFICLSYQIIQLMVPPTPTDVVRREGVLICLFYQIILPDGDSHAHRCREIQPYGEGKLQTTHIRKWFEATSILDNQYRYMAK